MVANHRIELEPAFILHRRPYRETSLLLDVFSFDHGRVNLVAKGASRPKSPLRAALQPFVRLSVSWAGRNELATLTAAEAQGAFAILKGRAIFSGLYINELLVRLLHRHDPHPELFTRYSDTLNALAKGDDTEIVLRIFEKHLLNTIGYGLVLDTDVESGEMIESSARYVYTPESGPCSSRAEAVGIAISGRTLQALAKESFEDQITLKESKRLMRYVIAHHLGNKPLAVRELMPQMYLS